MGHLFVFSLNGAKEFWGQVSLPLWFSLRGHFLRSAQVRTIIHVWLLLIWPSCFSIAGLSGSQREQRTPVKSGVWLQLQALPALWHRTATAFCHHSSAPFSTEGGWIRFTICLWQTQTGTGEHTCQPGGPEAYLSNQIIHFHPNWPPLYHMQQINLNKW